MRLHFFDRWGYFDDLGPVWFGFLIYFDYTVGFYSRQFSGLASRPTWFLKPCFALQNFNPGWGIGVARVRFGSGSCSFRSFWLIGNCSVSDIAVYVTGLDVAQRLEKKVDLDSCSILFHQHFLLAKQPVDNFDCLGLQTLP